MSLSAAAISSIIGGAAALGSAGINAASAATANRKAYKWSKKFFEFQNEYNMANYSPALNMERLRAAGINPHEIAGTPGSGTSMQGSLDVPAYQSPLAGSANALAQGIQTAISLWSQKKSLQNQSDLVQSQINKNNADAAKTNYTTENLLPLEMEYQKNRTKIPLYQLGVMKLQQQKMMNEISLFSMQKQKFQLALDLMQLEKEFHQQADKYRVQSIRWDSENKKNQAGISALDLKNYQDFGFRPQDPYYMRIGANVIDSLSGEDTWLGRLLGKYLFKK